MHQFRKEKSPDGYIIAVPRPTEEELSEFYRSTYFKEGITSTYQVEYSGPEIRQKQLRAEASVEFIGQNLADRDNVSMLEIGCGEGFLLNAAMKIGWQVLGVDFQREPIEKFNPKAAKCFVAAHPSEFLIEQLKQERKYDVIILQNVLEHILNPKRLLDDIRDIISDAGCVFVQVPNDYSRIQQKAIEQKRIDCEFWFAPPQHLNYFNANSLERFIGDTGYDIVDVFSDFPVELYLWGGEQNYVTNPALGKMAHNARVQLDLALSENGLDAYIDFYRSAYRVGIGRNLIAIIKPK